MVINVAIVEDEAKECAVLKGYLFDYAERNGITVDVAVYNNAESFLDKYNLKYDIIFMDIELPGENGMKAAEKLRKIDSDVVLVFITNLKKYVLKGYEVGALNYILKPIKYAGLNMTMIRAVNIIKSRKDSILHLRIDGGGKNIYGRDIYFIEIIDHDITIHTVNGDVCVYGSLGKLESQLSSREFFRVSANAIVNLKYIGQVIGNEITVNNKIITISRNKKKLFLQAMNNYLGGN